MCDVRAVLDVVWRPKFFRPGIITFVEQRVEPFQNELLVFLSRVIHFNFFFVTWSLSPVVVHADFGVAFPIRLTRTRPAHSKTISRAFEMSAHVDIGLRGSSPSTRLAERLAGVPPKSTH